MRGKIRLTLLALIVAGCGNDDGSVCRSDLDCPDCHRCANGKCIPLYGVPGCEDGPPLRVTELWVFSGKPYERDTLAAGKPQYIDRTFIIESVPAQYQGLTYLKTANDDKFHTDSPFLTFAVNQLVTVYVAHDERITPKPAWIEDWTDTGEALQAELGGGFEIYGMDFPSGSISLGANEALGPGSSMYTVIVEPRGIDPDAAVQDRGGGCSATGSRGAGGLLLLWLVLVVAWIRDRHITD